MTTNRTLVAEAIARGGGDDGDDDDDDDDDPEGDGDDESGPADAVYYVSAHDEVHRLDVDAATTGVEIGAFVAARLAPLVTRFESAESAPLFYGNRGPAVHALLFVNEKAAHAVDAVRALTACADVERDRVRHVVVPSTRTGVYVDVKINPKMSDLERDAAQTSRSRVEMSAS